MVPRSVAYEDMQSGDARPYEGTKNSFICKNTMQMEDFGGRFAALLSTELENFSPSVDNGFFLAGNTLPLILFAYTSDEHVEHETGVQGNPRDFIGVVCIPAPRRGLDLTQPVSNATVTIVSGPRSGEQISTDQTGRYVFPNVAGDEMHLRIEKKFFEPKEVMVYRDHPTTLANGNAFNSSFDPQRNPGTILIGLAWPEEVRFILRQNPIVYDLLYVESPLPNSGSGFYHAGVVVLNTGNVFGGQGVF